LALFNASEPSGYFERRDLTLKFFAFCSQNIFLYLYIIPKQILVAYAALTELCV